MKAQAKIAKKPAGGKVKAGSARAPLQPTSAPKIGNERVGSGLTTPTAATPLSEPSLPPIQIPKGFNIKQNLAIALLLRGLPLAAQYGAFALLVRPGGIWDYKQTFKEEGFIGEAFANKSRLNDVPAEYRNVIKPGDEILNPYEDFGNWHYGFMGSAAGIPSEILLRAAGAVQKYKTKTSRPNWSHPWPGGKPPFGDDPRDQKMVMEGIKDFYELHWFDSPRRQWVSPSLEVGHIDDPAEREAEAVAGHVMRMPDGGSCCSACAVGGPCASHAPQIELGQATPLRRTVAGVGNSAGLAVPAGLEPQVRRATSGGEALPATVRAFFEPRFGEDLSLVRIHRDGDAAESARALGAKAYTLGSHIAFSAGRWAPGTDTGDRLIAHELAHATANGNGPVRRKVDADDGTCLPGPMTPMAVGNEAHKQIQAAAQAFEIDTEAGIPKKASRGVPRADLFGVWTEPEARRRGLPTTRTPENDTPWVIAEIGEIKPVSYAQGGIRHADARKEIKDYLKYWENSSKVPAIPMRSLRSIGPLEFMGSELFCDLDFPVDGLYIYRCSKPRNPKEATVPAGVPIHVPKAAERELRDLHDIGKLPAMTPIQVRERLASDAPALLSFAQELVIIVGVVAATAAVVALIASAIPAGAVAAVAAALIAAASVNASPKGA